MMTTDWERVRAQLERRLADLNEEIGAYPCPITGCDAQFKHLLEERVRLNSELSRLETTKSDGQDAGALKNFMESCPFLTG